MTAVTAVTATDDEFTPTPEQAAAIGAPLEPVLLVAGAGTGKTTVMAKRIFALVASGQARADQILALTFTNKAALNLKEKVRKELGADAEVTVATYHAFGASLVADHALELGLDPGAQLLDRGQAWQLLFRVFDEFRFQRRSALMPSVVLADALVLASRAADYLVPIEVVASDCERLIHEAPTKGVRDTATGRLDLCQVVAAYHRRKQERNMLDYGDQVALAVRLLEEQPEVAEAERRRHPVVLLDEYQDTNYAQRRLLQLLYPRGLRGPNAATGPAVTAVGDDMQSIYAFRGAHLFNILHFEDHFPAALRQELQTTFRFGAPLTDVANRIQAQVSDALPKALRPTPGAAPTTVECFLAADDAEEAATIADDIVERHGAGAAWADHAVLCRKRRLIRPIVEALEARRVPVEEVGGSGLLERPEIVDLVAWIEVVADPAAAVALVRILQSSRYNIGVRDIAALARHSRSLDGGTLNDAVMDVEHAPDLSCAARSRIADFRQERDEFAGVATRTPLPDLAETIVLHTGLWHAAGSVGRENLLRFLDLADRFTPVEGDPGLVAFIEYLQLLVESEEDVAEAHEPGTDAVRVMTIHQAKGLEFPVVYVPGLAGSGSSRIFPDERSHENALSNASALPWWLRADDEGIPDPFLAKPKDIGDAIRKRRHDEEWRLLYVACTRARRHLVCSAAHWYAGPAAPQGPSEFFEFIASLAADGLVTERFRHDAATEDPEVAAKERRRAAAGGRYASEVATDPAQLRLDDVATAPAATAAPRTVPTGLSVTGLVSYARCPKQFYWTVVRPLPRRSSAAARLGTAVHRWIEQRSDRQLSLIEPEAADEGAGLDDPDSLPSGEGVVAALKASFLASPWAALEPEKVEAPFVLAAGQHLIRGRIDAVYRRDGRLELVDFKTGRPAAMGDRPATVQLNLYGLAAVDTWGADPDELRTTYCYLRTEGPPALLSADWDVSSVESVRADLIATLDQLATRQFDPTPGRWCRGCDFLPACPPGRREVEA